MKKQLPTDAITNELTGASVFFKPSAAPGPDQALVSSGKLIGGQTIKPNRVATTVQIEPLANSPTSKLLNQKASTLASYQQELVETIRKTVKKNGKEVSFVRLTRSEKDQLAAIVYTYKRQGVKTSENEINRIAINFLLEDYQRNGEESMLVRVIEALLA